MIGLTDDAAVHAEPISRLCSHDLPPFAATGQPPPDDPGTEGAQAVDSGEAASPIDV
jgi:hypothetical protein